MPAGDFHVIRNAGGRVDESAIRSLVISQRLLGTNEIFVIHHTNCGMETFGGLLIHAIADACTLASAVLEWHGPAGMFCLAPIWQTHGSTAFCS